MMNKRFFLNCCLSLVISISFMSCSSGGGSSDGGGGGSLIKDVTTRCGVVKKSSLVNPVSLYEGEQAILEAVVGTTILQVKRPGKASSEYISMVGLSPSKSVSRIKSALEQFVGSNVYLIDSENSTCQVPVRGAGSLNAYQVVSESGVSLVEFLVDQGLGELTGDTICGANFLTSCLSGNTGASSGRQVSNFLWKPSSESGFNPGGVSIILNPCDVRVFANGEEVLDYGPGNGRCITARSPHPGCDFGENVEVKIIEKSTGLPVLFGAQESYIIPNGCERVEYAGVGGLSVGEDEELPECEKSIDDLEYRPSWVECNGNAGVLMKGEFADAFNSALRMPDNSDRLDLSCTQNSCSPYKTQNFVDMVGGKLACYGAKGDSPLMSEVVQVSVKLTGDDRTPVRECLSDPSLPN